MPNRKVFIVAGILVLLGVPIALRLARSNDTKTVDVEAVGQRTLSPTVLASGNLTYATEVNLVPEIIGKVVELRVKEGDRVSKGELLLRIDPSTAKAQVDQLAAALAQSRVTIERQRVSLQTLETRWQRYKALLGQGMIDRNSAEDVKSQRDTAELDLQAQSRATDQTAAQLAAAREALAKTEIRAPISGRVTSLVIKLGETAVPAATSIAGSNLATIADTSSLYAEVNVNEADIATVHPDESARIVPAAYPDRAWTGIVERMAEAPKQLSGQSKTYEVRIRLNNSEGMQFHSGMSCRAEISTAGAGVRPEIAVPVQAVRYEESTEKNEAAATTVVLVRGGKAAVIPVETGTADDAYIAIRRGVALGDLVVTGPAKVLRFLREGDRLTSTVATRAAAKP